MKDDSKCKEKVPQSEDEGDRIRNKNKKIKKQIIRDQEAVADDERRAAARTIVHYY